MNTQTIMPMPVITGRAAYPEDIQEKLKECDIRLFTADALSLAKQAGSEKATNTVLLGVAARFSDIPKDKWIEAVKNTVPQKLLSLNLRAFELGYNL